MSKEQPPWHFACTRSFSQIYTKWFYLWETWLGCMSRQSLLYTPWTTGSTWYSSISRMGFHQKKGVWSSPLRKLLTHVTQHESVDSLSRLNAGRHLLQVVTTVMAYGKHKHSYLFVDTDVPWVAQVTKHGYLFSELLGFIEKLLQLRVCLTKTLFEIDR